jgi:hypothetical protein
MLGALAFAVKVVPAFVLGGIIEAASSAGAPSATPAAPSPSASPSTSPTSAKKPTAAPKTSPKARATPTPVALPVSRCAGLTAAQIGKIVGRQVQPIATQGSCAWGTRLDDPATTLVMLQTKAEPAAYETNFSISASQRRTVYGMAYLHYRPGTGLWVAAGQPIGVGTRPTTARIATHVLVSSDKLNVSDDRARALATSIAAAANAAR